MKDRKRKASSIPCFLYSIFLIFFSGLCLSTLRLLFKDVYRPRVVPSTRNSPAMKAVSGESTSSPAVVVQETVVFPDQALVFLKYPPSTALFTKEDIDCVYFTNDTSSPAAAMVEASASPISVDDDYFGSQIVRCPTPPGGTFVSVAVKPNGKKNLPAGPMLTWDSLAYEALIDQDNTTIVFAKGLNLRGGRTSDPTKFKCMYGPGQGSGPVLRSYAISVAQEIVRCVTPPSVLNSPESLKDGSIKVSIRVVGSRTLGSMARPVRRFATGPPGQKMHKMCVCTMLRNQARFLREWVMYHGYVGVQRWFIYDNNSNDEIENVIELLVGSGYNVTSHVWPWVKSQEAGFAHCALRARDTCEWVGFIDVDEFLHFPTGLLLDDVIENETRNRTNLGAIMAQCHSFGPSGLKRVPAQGVTVGYTCRLDGFERHKSIIRPEALNSSLINVVHHFDLRFEYESVWMSRRVMVVNHYKYQVWEVFKDKFYRRVATYVSDWQQDTNAGSKDRAPGLGTKAIEPPDWPTRFCEVKDTGLMDRVIKTFSDPKTGLLPWQDHPNGIMLL